jgi:hypothetical protein
MNEINELSVQRILETVDAGLVCGMGVPIPGQMCVEAAVCYGLNLPHGDDPLCVASAVRELKIMLNDSSWSSNAARAKGLRRLAIAQLGTRENFDMITFVQRVAVEALALARESDSASAVDYAESAVRFDPFLGSAVTAAVNACTAVRRAAFAISYKSRGGTLAYDGVLADFAEKVVQILISMGTPGSKFLPEKI